MSGETALNTASPLVADENSPIQAELTRSQDVQVSVARGKLAEGGGEAEEGSLGEADQEESTLRDSQQPEGSDAQDQTLVDDSLDIPATKSEQASSTHHTKSASKSSVSSVGRGLEAAPQTNSVFNEPWDITKWKPLQGVKGTYVRGSAEQDQTLVVEKEEDVTDSGLGFLKADGGRGVDDEEVKRKTSTGLLKVSPAVSRRPSALQIKPPSPQPWDLIPPPEDNMKGSTLAPSGRSPAVSNRFPLTP